MNIAVLCHTSAGGSGIVGTELAVALSECGHDVHIIGERQPFRLASLLQQRNFESPEIYRDLGTEPPAARSFWGDLVRLARRSMIGRFLLSEEREKKLHFHELLSFEYPLFSGTVHPTIRATNTLASVIERYNIEIVHAHYAIPHTTSAILARDAGLPIKVVTTLHGTDVTTVGRDAAYHYTTKHALNSSDAVTAVSGSLIQAAREIFGLSRDIRHIPNWVDGRRFKRIDSAEERARYAQPEEAIFVHLSNFRPVKRSPNVVRIFAKACERIPARLILIGDGPEKADCMQLAMDLGVQGRVLSMPAIAEVEKMMGIADVLLLPSESEAFPLAALEAMASGAVVIASSVGGLPELISSNESGFLFDSSDLDAMAAAAVEIFEDKERMAAMRERAREEVLLKFQPETIVQQYVELYNAVVQ